MPPLICGAFLVEDIRTNRVNVVCSHGIKGKELKQTLLSPFQSDIDQFMKDTSS
jgi:hypothetical protein